MTTNIREVYHPGGGIPIHMPASANLIGLVDATGSTTYAGEAAPGARKQDAVWRIKRVTVAGDLTSINFADSSNNFDKEWDERANYDYTITA